MQCPRSENIQDYDYQFTQRALRIAAETPKRVGGAKAGVGAESLARVQWPCVAGGNAIIKQFNLKVES
ncbi:MAG TPA: hypothetical protein VGD65_06290 [Chryseosolibacter sp.]